MTLLPFRAIAFILESINFSLPGEPSSLPSLCSFPKIPLIGERLGLGLVLAKSWFFFGLLRLLEINDWKSSIGLPYFENFIHSLSFLEYY